MTGLTLRPAGLPCLALLLLAPSAAAGQSARPAAEAAPAAPTRPYPRFAALVIDSPTVIDATIRSATRIRGAEAAGVAAGRTRFYVEADVAALIRAPGALPPRIGYVYDAPNDANGRPPRVRRERVLLFARPVAGRPGQVQLTDPAAQLAWTPANEALARRIAAEVVAPDAPPVVTGVRSAFYVAGSLPGEGETQVFLATRDNRPASLSVLRRPGERPRWAVALSEIVDDAARPPARETLLWYRLACALPPRLPDAAVAALSPQDADQARIDYRFVVEQLGPCERGEASAAPATLTAGAGPA